MAIISTEDYLAGLVQQVKDDILSISVKGFIGEVVTTSPLAVKKPNQPGAITINKVETYTAVIGDKVLVLEIGNYLIAISDIT